MNCLQCEKHFIYNNYWSHDECDHSCAVPRFSNFLFVYLFFWDSDEFFWQETLFTIDTTNYWTHKLIHNDPCTNNVAISTGRPLFQVMTKRQIHITLHKQSAVIITRSRYEGKAHHCHAMHWYLNTLSRFFTMHEVDFFVFFFWVSASCGTLYPRIARSMTT